MIQNLLPLLPRRIGALGIAVGFASTALGAGLWLLGARFSRPLLATAATLGGGVIGFQSPRWFGWTLDPWTLAVLGSLILGVVGFMTHRWLAGLGLGIIVATWAALGTVAAGVASDSGAVLSGRWIGNSLSDLRNAIPDTLAQWLVLAILLGLFAGLTIAFLWQRLGVVLFWSMLGSTLFLWPALSAVQSAGVRYTRWIPPHGQTQALALTAMVALGAAVQWRFTFYKRRQPKAAPATPKPE